MAERDFTNPKISGLLNPLTGEAKMIMTKLRIAVAPSVINIFATNVDHWRSQDFVLRGPDNREGVSPPQPTRGLGERRKLPQRGPGRSPGRKQILVHFELKNESGDDKFDRFFVNFIAHI